ncbi:serotriflin-like [Hemicordylus capensis]|uniref:serotriflin-like n=1 Tax=Hemicordylus capensis TaxID=884348 RepID=UPI002302EB60|nr:serotriflin-like [Hemicordylus capensis]
MSLLVTLLALATGLHHCVGKEQDAAVYAALSTDLPNIQKEIVDKHNALRKQVEPTASNMLRMEWNETAAITAKNWAVRCNQVHSPADVKTIDGVECGENLFMLKQPMPWSFIIQEWFNERKNFIYGKGGKQPNAMIGHYLQVVWYKSYKIACAVAQCPNSKYNYFYVCHYCPSGNDFKTPHTPYKQGKQCGDCPNNCEDGLCKMWGKTLDVKPFHEGDEFSDEEPAGMLIPDEELAQEPTHKLDRGLSVEATQSAPYQHATRGNCPMISCHLVVEERNGFIGPADLTTHP